MSNFSNIKQTNKFVLKVLIILNEIVIISLVFLLLLLFFQFNFQMFVIKKPLFVCSKNFKVLFYFFLFFPFNIQIIDQNISIVIDK